MIKKKLSFQVLVTVCLLSYLYSTRYHLPFIDSTNWVQATDVFSYLVISSSAPNLPTESISFHFAQRWIPHYIVGYLADLLNMELGWAYGLSNGMVVALILIFSWSVLLQVAKDQKLGLIIFLLVVLSVFSFRLYIFVPGLFADLIFVLGLAVALKGSLVELLLGCDWYARGNNRQTIVVTDTARPSSLYLCRLGQVIWESQGIFHGGVAEPGRHWLLPITHLHICGLCVDQLYYQQCIVCFISLVSVRQTHAGFTGRACIAHIAAATTIHIEK